MALFIWGKKLAATQVLPLNPELLQPKLAPVLVTDSAGLSLVRDFLSRETVFGLDTETNFVDDVFDRVIRTIQIGNKQEQYIIDLLSFAGTTEALIASQGNFGVAAELLLGGVIQTIAPALENHDITKVGQNLQFDYEVLRWCLGIRATGFYDCQRVENNILAGLVHLMAKGVWAMEDLVRKYVGLEMQTEGSTSFDLSSPLTPYQLQYGALDVRLPMAVRNAQLAIVEREGLQNAIQIDCDAISAFGDMYLTGIGMDDTQWQAIIDRNLARKRVVISKLDEKFIPAIGTKTISEADWKKLDSLEVAWRDCPSKTPDDKQRRKDHRIAYVAFRHELSERSQLGAECEGLAAVNYGSPKQLLKALRKLGFNAKKLPTTDDGVLEKLAKYPNLDVDTAFAENDGKLDYPVIDLLRLYRTLDKLLDTYGDAWLKTTANGGHRNVHTNRIHSKINLFGAATGRTSSSEPNIQNIPKDDIFRHCFVARPGYRILTVDYSGCELRILAYLSQEPVWLEAFSKGWDVHSVGAEILYGQQWKDAAEPGCKYYSAHEKCKCKLHKKLRNNVKSINFGLAYGLSAPGLARQLNITVAEAEVLLERYKAAFPTVMKYLDRIGEQAKATLRVVSIEGGRRQWHKPDWEVAKARALADEVALAKRDKRDPRPITSEMVRRKYVGMARSIEREGKNAGIQRANSYLTKRAMFLIWRSLLPVYGAFFVNEVHDEVVIECPEATADACLTFVSECMMAAGAEYIHGIPMEVEPNNELFWTK